MQKPVKKDAFKVKENQSKKNLRPKARAQKNRITKKTKENLSLSKNENLSTKAGSEKTYAQVTSNNIEKPVENFKSRNDMENIMQKILTRMEDMDKNNKKILERISFLEKQNSNKRAVPKRS